MKFYPTRSRENGPTFFRIFFELHFLYFSKRKNVFSEIDYSIFLNFSKRYDLTGCDDDDGCFEAAYSFFRDIFPKISTEDIENFTKTYVGSQEEKDDILKHLTR
jgi:hypothetical protein